MTAITLPPSCGEVYRHHRGLLYRILCLAKDQDNQELLIIHQGADGQIWSRTVGNFMAYSGEVPRFTLVKRAEDDTEWPDFPA